MLIDHDMLKRPLVKMTTAHDVSYRRIRVEDTIALRHSVLWPNEDVSKVLLPEDDTGHHFGAFLDSRAEPVAVVSLFHEGIAEDDNAARFRKFACVGDFQGRGIGTGLLLEVFRFAQEVLGARIVWCDARETKSDWYERRGMSRFGTKFYKGPVEYVRMKIVFK